MKICLLTPPDREIPYHPPDLGLGYLASSLISEGHEIVILNPNKYNTEKKTLNYIFREKFEMVGIKIISRLSYRAVILLKKIKKINPQIKTIIGGPHPSGDPVKVKKEIPCADYLFVGEAEVGFPMLINVITSDIKKKKGFENRTNLLKKIPGLVYSSKNKINVNLPYFEPDIDKFKMPSWKLMPPAEYFIASMCRFFKSYPVAPIIATRGCPFNCIFCAAHCVAGKELRLRSPELVLNEIKYLYNNFAVKEFQFVDDNLTLNKKHLTRITSSIIDSRLKISWSCPNGVRLDTLDEEILALMAKSGCHTLCLGIESGSLKILNSIKKRLTIEDIKSKVSLIKKYGIKTIGMFIIGLPGEKEEDILKTIKFACYLPIDGASFMLCTPLPGSKIYDNYLKKKNKINWKQFCYKGNNDYNYSLVPYNRLKLLQKYAFLKFHLRPEIIKKTFSSISSMEHFIYFFRRVLRGFLLS